MNNLAFHIASGDSSYSGSALISVGIIFAFYSHKPWSRLAFVLILTGIVFMALSSSSLPLVGYVTLTICLVHCSVF